MLVPASKNLAQSRRNRPYPSFSSHQVNKIQDLSKNEDIIQNVVLIMFLTCSTHLKRPWRTLLGLKALSGFRMPWWKRHIFLKNDVRIISNLRLLQSNIGTFLLGLCQGTFFGNLFCFVTYIVHF